MEPMIVFVMALFITTSQAHFHMSLEPTQREISLQIGETFQFKCEAFDCPNPTFTWASLMDKTLSGTVSTEGSKSILTMQVSNDSDGSYVCKVFCNQHKEEKSFTISIYSFASEPVLYISSLVAEVQSSIICTVPLVYPSEILSLRLLKDKEMVAEYDSSMQIYQDGGFQLRNVSLSYDWIPHVEDEGSVIECKADMSFADEEIKPIIRATNVILSVAYPPSNPSITVLPSQSIKAGEDISLGCSSESRPQATVRWVKESGNVENELPSENGHLELTGVQPQESGKYICYVENEAGRNSASVVITVQVTPKNTRLTITPSELVREGDQVIIQCTSEAFPAPTLILKEKTEHGEVELETTSGKHIITSATVEHSGTYTCRSMNPVGDEVAEIILTVQGVPSEPEISILPATTVIQGQAVTIKCVGHRDGDTLVTLWKVSEETLQLSRDGIVHIERAGPMDAAVYKCKTSNQYGEREAMESLTVHFPPKNTRLTITPSKLVREGDQVIIQCTSEAFPAPTLILKEKTEHSEVELETTGGKHIITSATVEHSGTYTCRSRNPVGDEVAELSLTVQVPPQNTTIHVKPSRNVTEGDNVTITCETHSSPLPTILLKKVCAGNTTIQQAQNGTFTLHNVTRNDTGTYVLSIYNEAGNMTELIQINVQARYQSPLYSFATPIIATSLFAVSAAVIGLIVYHMKQARIQGSYSLVEALRSRV